MAIEAVLRVPQGDDHPLHVTVRNKSDLLPKDLTGWSAYIEVKADARVDTPVMFKYDSTTDAAHCSVDPGTGGGISIVFDGSDIATPSEMDPDAYRIKIVHPSEAPNGRTVRFGPFIVEDT